MVDISLTMILQWLNFAVLLFLLTKLLYKPLIAFLDKRRDEVQNSYDEAQQAKDEAEEVLNGYRKKIEGAEQEAMDIKFASRNEGMKEREKIISRAEDEAGRILTRAEEEIRLEEKKARKRLREETVDLSISIARKLMEREIDRDDQRRFIGESIKELEGADG